MMAMNKQRVTRYFLGGNTADGFYSLYDSFISQKQGDFLWIIKGGAGCGKSSFMKALGAAAESAGLDTEYVQCSGDPESLDGLYIPKLKTAYMDGTAPHAADARIAAADSAYIDLGAFYDRAAIAQHRGALEELFAANKAQYAKAYSLLSAAGSLRRGWQAGLCPEKERMAAMARVDGIAQRELGRRAKQKGSSLKRLISGNTCKGLITLPDTVAAECKNLYSFENRRLLGNAAIARLAERAVGAGHNIILCPDPLTPELYEAMFVPELSLGFICGTKKTAKELSVRNIRLDSSVSGNSRAELKACEKQIDILKSEAYAALADAKRIHDDIERIYNPNVDFDGVYKTVREHISALGL